MDDIEQSTSLVGKLTLDENDSFWELVRDIQGTNDYKVRYDLIDRIILENTNYGELKERARIPSKLWVACFERVWRYATRVKISE